MKTIYKLFLLTVLTLLPAVVLALSPQPPDPDPIGPVVPCVGCENLTKAPYPETGLWSNPEQSPGSGLNFEIQNGVIAGYLYTYSDTGQPEWFLLSGPLVRSEKNGVMWELDTRLIRVEGGSCIGCLFTPPDQITEGLLISLEFMQRNYLKIKIADTSFGGALVNFHQFFVPFTYGSAAKAHFSEQTPYLMPVLGKQKYREPFLLSIRPANGGEETNPWFALHVYIRGPFVNGDPENRVVKYKIWGLQPNGPQIPEEIPPPYGVIICALDEESGQPGCEVTVEDITYTMPIGNFGDSRFFGEAEDGSIIEALRIEYD